MEPKQKQVCWWVPLVKKSINDKGKKDYSWSRAARNDKKEQVIVCVQIHRQTSKADIQN